MIRNRRAFLWASIVFLAILVASCSGAAQPAPVASEPAPQVAQVASPTLEPSPPEANGAVSPVPGGGSEVPVASPPEELAAWMAIPLTDVRTGETFTLADFKGRVVIVESMAVWCPLCTTQQQHIGAALGELGDNVVAISLDTDPGENAGILAAHADAEGFEWAFAIAPPELNNALVLAYGPSVLTAPATPVILIDPQGQPGEPLYGINEASDLVRRVQQLTP